MKIKPYIVYVKTDSNGYITAVNSSAFLTDTTDWVEIDSGYGDKQHHAQGNYFDKPIMTMGGAYRYKLVDGEVVECTPDEIAEQEAANMKPAEPTQQDRWEAQLTYTAMMTDTLLEV
jgi:hypothetical protein